MKKHFLNCGKRSAKKQAFPQRFFAFFFSLFFLFFSCIVCVFFISCRTLSQNPESEETSGNKTFQNKNPETDKNLEIERCFFSDEEISWRQLEEGFQIFSYSDSEIGIKYTLVKINLSNPDLEIVSLLPEFSINQELLNHTESINTPGKENKSPGQNRTEFGKRTELGWAKTKSVEKFARETDSLVAINTTPFMTEHKNPFSKAKPAGLQIADGKMISKPNGKYSAIAFFKNLNKDYWSEDLNKCYRNENHNEKLNERRSENYKNPENRRKHISGGFHAEIFDSQSELFTGRAETQNGIKQMPDFAHGGFWTILRNGEIKPFKEIKDVRSAAALKDSGKTLILFIGKPFTYPETARLFKKLGADSAIQFDGGSSANLVVNGKSCLKTGVKRKTASAIGFRLSKNPSGNFSEEPSKNDSGNSSEPLSKNHSELSLEEISKNHSKNSSEKSSEEPSRNPSGKS